MDVVSPKCPNCGSDMVLRTARRGPNAGNQFWGCSDYPSCKGTQDLDGQHDGEIKPAGQPSSDDGQVQRQAATQVPVPWSDRISRQGWIAEYTTIGSLSGFSRGPQGDQDGILIDCLSQTLVLSRRSRPRSSSEAQKAAASLLGKILQRGRSPLPTMAVERAAIRTNDLERSITEFPEDSSELGFDLARGKLSRVDLIAALSKRSDFVLGSEFSYSRASETPLFDSQMEEKFISQWVPAKISPAAGHWFVPQASLDRLLEAHGASDGGARRVDFLFTHPATQPLAIELDGPEHSDDPVIDQQRDKLLSDCGIRVIRVPNDEVDRGEGPALEAIRLHCAVAFTNSEGLSDDGQSILAAVADCSNASKFQLAITRALQFGWLEENGTWYIDVAGVGKTAHAAVADLLELLAGLDRLYDTAVSPFSVLVSVDGHMQCLKRNANGMYSVSEIETPPQGDPLRINVQGNAGPFHDIPIEMVAADIIIRPVFLPIQLAVESTYSGETKVVKGISREDAETALTPFLRQIFRKRQFRPLQAQAILNALRHIDCIVLLPTGSGKSIVYQLAGLLMPGVTLVVDPIVSLIEDQVEGLLQYGIDRAVGITSALSSQSDRERLLRGVERGAYQFVLHSPERLQSPAFRETLRALAETSKINLAVIDEAHCVSEWGHDFRPAYLNLGRNLRAFGKDRNGHPPPMIALTGTASRSVLRDVLTELDIDRSNSDALIRPHSFDRAELHFHISRPERTDDVEASLRGALHGLPDKFGMPKDEFYRPAGRNTASGIIFVPFVNGRTHGILSTKAAVRTATGAIVTNYSGKAPKGQDRNWEIAKRQNVREFKSNNAPILVSTKAFGMGIDKPNIRYTLHMGMPGSLEAFYQEAGRAGRDRRDAHCVVVFSEFDEGRTDELLDPSIDLEETRVRYAEHSKKRKNDDDISRVLWFHLNAFSGQEIELIQAKKVLDWIESIDLADTIDLPFSGGINGRSDQERALFRLVKVGVIRDYEVIFGSKFFRLYISAFDLDKCKENLLVYVVSAQPGRIKMFAKELDEIETSDAKVNALQLVELLIDFTYDVIERSRRRAIQESIQLARHSKSDGEVRRRLLDYLQEGVGAEQFDSLLDETNVRFDPWREFVDKILSPVDAGEIRGMAIRSLESYPDHPGLLLLRGVSEMMCSDADENASFQVLNALLQSSGQRYGISEQELAEVFSWMTDLVDSKASGLGLPLAVAFYQAADESRISPELRKIGDELLGAIDVPEVTVVKQVMTMGELANNIGVATNCIALALDDHDLHKLIGRVA
jgi:ATP-dependent DNA helicase RecQ